MKGGRSRRSDLVKEKRGDRSYKEIKRQINKRNRRMQEEDIIQTVYVDSYRMISVSMGSGGDDLKRVIAAAGTKIKDGEKIAPGEPNLEMHLKLAKHLLKHGHFEAALHNVQEAAEFNPDSPEVVLMAAKINLKQGQWDMALTASDFVLKAKPKWAQASLCKAEALFNLCQFEKALSFFHRGQVLAPDNDDFRLGIQKCRKTIEDAVRDSSVFRFKGISSLFEILRMNADYEDQAKIAGYVERSLEFQNDGLFNVVSKMQQCEKAGAKARILGAIRKRKNVEKEKMELSLRRSMLPLANVDRLSQDKTYLSRLCGRLQERTDIAVDEVQMSIAKTTSETLQYLRTREPFWEQLEMRKDEQGQQLVESYRWLM